MKKIFFGFTLIFVNLLNAQTAERVYSIAKEQRPLEWYQEQEVLWLKILKKDKKMQRRGVIITNRCEHSGFWEEER